MAHKYKEQVVVCMINMFLILAIPAYSFMFCAIGKPTLEPWGACVSFVVLVDLLAWKWYNNRPPRHRIEVDISNSTKSDEGGAFMDGTSLSYILYHCTYYIVLVLEYGRETVFRKIEKEIKEATIRVFETGGITIIDVSVRLDRVDLAVSIPPEKAWK